MFVRLAAPLAVLFSIFTLATASPLQRLNDRINELSTRQQGAFAITGATGGLHPRLEIREMQKNAPLWNLFLAAFEQWQAVDQNDKLSYFQIAAIHGQPLQPWDGVESTGDPLIGYCPHDSNMFGTWHRPFLAVFEQLLQAQAITIANALPDGDSKTQYQGLAQQLRWPYWDWAAPKPGSGSILPESVTTETIDIAYPNGTTAKRPNPLFQYTFHPLNNNWFGGDYNVWPRTVRNPVDIKDTNSPSVNADAETNLQKDQANRRSSLYNILTQHQTFNQFSNHGSGNSPIGSLESIHDGVHSVFGTGHMYYLTVSAFDPIFWLHHANVDRLITLFQYIYPDTWIEPWSQRGNTYAYRAGTTLSSNSPLYPFHASSSADDFWTSATAANWRTFGYTYPELVGEPPNATVRASVNKLYGDNDDDGQASGINKRDVAGKTYLAAIEAPLMALNGPYQVQVWLGTPGPASLLALGPSDTSYVGSLAILAQPGMASTDTVRGSVPLTERLNRFSLLGLLADLGLDSVLGSLETELHYRVVQDGVEVPKERVPGLKVAVFEADVEPAGSESDFPIWGALRRHMVATDGWAAWDGDF